MFDQANARVLEHSQNGYGYICREDKLTLEFQNIPNQLVIGLRRTLMTLLPGVSIDPKDINFIVNTTGINNQHVAHILSCCVVCTESLGIYFGTRYNNATHARDFFIKELKPEFKDLNLSINESLFHTDGYPNMDVFTATMGNNVEKLLTEPPNIAPLSQIPKYRYIGTNSIKLYSGNMYIGQASNLRLFDTVERRSKQLLNPVLDLTPYRNTRIIPDNIGFPISCLTRRGSVMIAQINGLSVGTGMTNARYCPVAAPSYSFKKKSQEELDRAFEQTLALNPVSKSLTEAEVEVVRRDFMICDAQRQYERQEGSSNQAKCILLGLESNGSRPVKQLASDMFFCIHLHIEDIVMEIDRVMDTLLGKPQVMIIDAKSSPVPQAPLISINPNFRIEDDDSIAMNNESSATSMVAITFNGLLTETVGGSIMYVLNSDPGSSNTGLQYVTFTKTHPTMDEYQFLMCCARDHSHPVDDLTLSINAINCIRVACLEIGRLYDRCADMCLPDWRYETSISEKISYF